MYKASEAIARRLFPDVRKTTVHAYESVEAQRLRYSHYQRGSMTSLARWAEIGDRQKGEGSGPSAGGRVAWLFAKAGMSSTPPAFSRGSGRLGMTVV